MPSIESIASSAGATIGATLGSALGSQFDSHLAQAAAEAAAAATDEASGGDGSSTGTMFPFGAVIGTSIGAALGSGLGQTVAARMASAKSKKASEESSPIGEQAVATENAGRECSAGSAAAANSVEAIDPSTPAAARLRSRGSAGGVEDKTPGMVQVSPSTPLRDDDGTSRSCSSARAIVCTSCGAKIMPNASSLSLDEDGSVARDGKSKKQRKKKKSVPRGKGMTAKKANKAGDRKGSKHRLKSTTTTGNKRTTRGMTKTKGTGEATKNGYTTKLKRLSGLSVLLSSSYYDLHSYSSTLGPKAICIESDMARSTLIMQSKGGRKGRKGGFVKDAGSRIVNGWKRMVENPQEADLLSISARAYSR